MSVWQDLLSVSITVEAHLLEELLDVLAGASFPINPEIQHHTEILSRNRRIPAVKVEFPAWREQMVEIQSLVKAHRLDAELSVSPMLEEVRA